MNVNDTTPKFIQFGRNNDIVDICNIVDTANMIVRNYDSGKHE